MEASFKTQNLNASLNADRATMPTPIMARDSSPSSETIVKPATGSKKSPLDFFKRMPRRRRIMIGLATFALLLFAGRETYLLFTTETTDDSFVTAHVHMIGSRIIGTVGQVLVEENQVVKKGDVLFKLDPKDFEVSEKIAEANFIRAHKDLTRWTGVNYMHPDERILNNADTASALTTEAQLEQAKLQIVYTQIVAPEDGKVGKRSVETGQQVLPGQALIALVEKNPWINANFKESQIAHLRVGQKAKIEIDAIPGHTFYGHVDSLSPGSGSTFALLPPDNATGNFTKIVQRIPVKIVFDPESTAGYEDRISSGMSSDVTVYTN
jgi:membrane fusion protein, multidrug efflux system